MKRPSCRRSALAALRWGALLGVLLSGVGPALAEDAPTRATRLFEEGRSALAAGDVPLACSKFAASQALDKRVGTLLNLALCHEKRAMHVQALDYWRRAEQYAAGLGDGRAELARERAQKLEAQVPTLTITLAADAPPGAVVRWADSFRAELQPLAPAQLGTPLPVNAGTVRVLVDAPGRDRSSYELAMALYDRKALTVKVGPVVDGPGPAPAVSPTAAPATPGKPSPPDEGDDGTALQVTGFVLGGVGVVGLGLGAVFGGMAMSKQSESNEIDPATGQAFCDSDDACSDAGLALRGDAIDAATVSTVAFVAGGALLAAGVVLVLVAPDGDDAAGGAPSALRLHVGPARASVQLVW